MNLDPSLPHPHSQPLNNHLLNTRPRCPASSASAAPIGCHLVRGDGLVSELSASAPPHGEPPPQKSHVHLIPTGTNATKWTCRVQGHYNRRTKSGRPWRATHCSVHTLRVHWSRVGNQRAPSHAPPPPTHHPASFHGLVYKHPPSLRTFAPALLLAWNSLLCLLLNLQDSV